MPIHDVIEHMHHLIKENIREVVLTGIHLGAYGADFTPASSLCAVVEMILKDTSIDRLRLSSIEPTEIDEHLIELALHYEGRVCRHFHVPLQSGDDDTLRRMGRPYTAGQFAEIIQTIIQRIPEAAIGIDVMAGFPGESDSAFTATYQLLERLPISYLHVFPYSPRKGTPAASYGSKVTERIAKDRCRALRALGDQKRAAFFHSMMDRTVEVLTQTASGSNRKYATGLSDNYVPVTVVDEKVKENEIMTVRIVEITADGEVIGRLTNRY